MGNLGMICDMKFTASVKYLEVMTLALFARSVKNFCASSVFYFLFDLS